MIKTKKKNILVFDLGGSNLNTSILEFGENGYFQILDVENESQINGNNFNISLKNYILSKRKNEIKINNEILGKLNIYCENIKKKLSLDNKTDLYITNFNKQTIIEEITREDLENTCKNEFEKRE